MNIKEILKSANKTNLNFDIEVFVEDEQAYVTIGTENATGFTTEVKTEDDVVNTIRGYIEDALEELS